MSRGRFISFEGGEGGGKSTQLRLLVQALRERGLTVLATREPGGTPLGEAARAWLLAPEGPPLAPPAELLLFGAARAQLVADVLEPALGAGTWVVADRFLDSTTVYQSVARGLDRDLVSAVHTLAVGACLPDRTLVLDVPVDTGLARAHAQQEFAAAEPGDRIEREARAFHEAVRAGYHCLAQDEPARVRLIDATGPIEVVHAACWAAVSDLVPEP